MVPLLNAIQMQPQTTLDSRPSVVSDKSSQDGAGLYNYKGTPGFENGADGRAKDEF